MSKEPLNPGEIARGDELMAFARDDLAKLAIAIPSGDKEKGGAQNTADFIAWLASRHNPAYLAALVVAAARQLAG